MTKKVAMIGVGKLGQDCAEVMSLHYDVVGYDVEPRNPCFPMKNTIEEAVKDRDLIFIAAPTPHDPIYGGETPTSHLPNKDFDYTIVTNILKEVNKHVNQNQLVVLISTVLPGTVRSQLRPCITNARFIYNPYLIAMGTIKWDMVNPEMVIIGTEDGSLTGDALELIEFYKQFMENDPRYEVGTWDEAEAIKIFYNTFISTKLALVNMIQDVAETNGNMNVDVVTQALAKSDYRIMGPAYMKAGLGDAGACHPRDNIALRYLADRLDLGYDLFDAIMTAREKQAERMALRCLRNGRKVTIIGKAYKPKVHYTNGSASMLVGYYIEKHGGEVNYYDIHTGDLDLRKDWTDVYLIGYWEQYVESAVTEIPIHAVVIDPWRKVRRRQCAGEIIHYGKTSKPATNDISTAPHQEFMTGPYKSFFCSFPELERYKDKIHFVFASTHGDFPFDKRPTEEITKEINQARSEGKKIVFYNSCETFIPNLIFKAQRILSLYQDAKPNEFFFAVGVPNGQEFYDNLRAEFNWKDRFIILGSHQFEFFISQFARIQEAFKQPYEVKPKEKLFVCFNKLHRRHRLRFLAESIRNNWVDKSYFSFEGAHKNWQYEPNLWPLGEHDKNAILTLQDKFPLRLNINEKRENPVEVIPEDLVYHQNSYFSVVTETIFYKFNPSETFLHYFNTLFLSEKIYKPFALKHPFILLGWPGALHMLRERGYKTFHPFINESYDLEYDDEKRFQMVVNEIKRLEKFTTEQWIEWQNNVKNIVEYNYNFLTSLTEHRCGPPVDQYFRD